MLVLKVEFDFHSMEKCVTNSKGWSFPLFYDNKTLIRIKLAFDQGSKVLFFLAYHLCPKIGCSTRTSQFSLAAFPSQHLMHQGGYHCRHLFSVCIMHLLHYQTFAYMRSIGILAICRVSDVSGGVGCVSCTNNGHLASFGVFWRG